MKKIIPDCDNTTGMSGRPVDDGPLLPHTMAEI